MSLKPGVLIEPLRTSKFREMTFEKAEGVDVFMFAILVEQSAIQAVD